MGQIIFGPLIRRQLDVLYAFKEDDEIIEGETRK